MISSKEKDDALIKVWNRLDGMWSHELDGSFFYPTQPNKVQYEGRSKDSIHFDIIFNEISHIIRGAVDESRKKELN